MFSAFALYPFLFASAGFASVLVAIILFRHRAARGALPLLGLVLANALWAWCDVLILAAPFLPLKQLAFSLSDAAYYALMPLLLLFVFDYCGYGARLAPRALLLIWALPALSVALAWTNPWHGLVYRQVIVPVDPASPLTYQAGPWSTVYSAFTYGLYGISLYLLISTLSGVHTNYRRQMIWVLGAALLPLVSDFLGALGVMTPSGMYFTPLAIALAGILLAIAVTRRSLLDLLPLARSVVFDTMQDAVLVTDLHGRIVELNRAAQRLFHTAPAVGQPLARVAPELATYAHNATSAELELASRFMDVHATPVRDRRAREMGRILTLHDVSEHHRLAAELEQMNARLEANVRERTQELAETIEQLQNEIAERERVETSLRAMEESLAERVARQGYKLGVLYDVILFGGQALSIRQIQAQALALVLNVMHADAGCVLDYDMHDNTLRVATQRELTEQEQLQELATIPPEWLIRDRVPHTVLDLERDTSVPAVLRRHGMRALLSVSLYLHETPCGALLVFWRNQPAIAVEDIALFSAMGDQLVILTENARLRQRAEWIAAQQERRRLARDLHDSVTQSLHSLVLSTDVAAHRLQQGKLERLDESLAQLGTAARQALKEMRLLLYELRLAPIDQINLFETLALRLDAVERRAGMDVQFCAGRIENVPRAWTPDLYAIAIEALNNSLKHARATCISVQFRPLPHGLEMEIADNGCGFDANHQVSGGLGLHSMRERAEKLGGALMLETAPERGTCVRVRVEQNI